MTVPTSRELRKSLTVYTKKSTSKALMILMTDIVIYIGAMSGVIFFNSIFLKAICGCLLGFKMASLFVIGHDSAHDSFANNSLLNKIIARISFLPSYHNYSLWLIVHNRHHHQSTNMKNINSWSPLSKQDYDNLSTTRKILERVYRCPYGISLNYVIERWWKNKFFPFKQLVGEFKFIYWLDFSLVLAYLISQIGLLIYLGVSSINSSVIEMILFGFFLPFVVFGFMVGFSVYQQHTHESVPWFDNEDDKKAYGQVEDVSLHVKYPRWYNILSHNVMEHIAHHVDPRIPSYNLEKAQSKLDREFGDKLKIMPFSLKAILTTMRHCKLYDYKNHCWTDYQGVRTSSFLIDKNEMTFLEAA